MKLADILAAWNHFWFELRSPLPTCIFRILYGLHVLFFCVLIYPDLMTWYLPNGMLSMQPYREWLGSERFSLLFWLPQTESSVYAVFALLAIAAITLTIGFCSRTSAVVLCVMLVSLHNRNLIILNSGDGLMRMMGIYLMFSHCGSSLSVDAWLKKRAGVAATQTEFAIWAQRLMQLQICAVYLHSVLAKSFGTPWLDGTTVYYVLQLREFYRVQLPFLLTSIWFSKVLTWGTLFAETAMFTLVWVKELRYYVLALGLLLHAGIELTMNIPQFETLMMSSYILFVDPQHLQWLLDRLIGKRGQPLEPQLNTVDSLPAS